MNLISLSIFLCFISFFWKDSFNSSKLCCISFLRTLNILLLSLISIIGSLLLIRGLFILWFITKSKKDEEDAVLSSKDEMTFKIGGCDA